MVLERKICSFKEIKIIAQQTHSVFSHFLLLVENDGHTD